MLAIGCHSAQLDLELGTCGFNGGGFVSSLYRVMADANNEIMRDRPNAELDNLHEQSLEEDSILKSQCSFNLRGLDMRRMYRLLNRVWSEAG